MSLPAELRNRIYEECLPSSTKLPASYEGHREGIWLTARQRLYKKTVAYVRSLNEHELECIPNGDWWIARATGRGTGRGRGRGRASNLSSNNYNQSDSAGKEPQNIQLLSGSNILSVCKQIYAEAAPMMYARPLVFTSIDGLCAFAGQLSPRTAKLIRSIEIRCWTKLRSRKSQGYSAISMLAAKGVTNLTSLFINCSMGYFHYRGYRRGNGRKESPPAKKIARKVYRDCHLWLETMGSCYGDVYKGLEVLQLSGEMFLGNESSWEDVQDDDKAMYEEELRRLLRAGAR